MLLSLQNDSSPEVLIWKHPEEDFNTNSVLTVQPGENVIFLSEGKIAAYFDKEGRYELKTNNHFFVGDLRNLLSQGKSTFAARLYFVRLNVSQEIGWGIGEDDPIAVRDPKLNIATELKGFGTIRIQIADAQKLMVNLLNYGIDSFTGSDIMDFFGGQMRQTVKSAISSDLRNSSQEILGITARLSEYSTMLTGAISGVISGYGLKLNNFSISDLSILRNPHRERVEDGFAARKEADILGEKFAQVKMAEIGMNAARNSGGAMNGFIGTSLAGAFAGVLGGQQNITTPPVNEPKTLKERLAELKEALDADLLTQEEFDEKRRKMIDGL